MGNNHQIVELNKTISGINKPMWFLEVYDELFSEFKNKKVTVMEIGVCRGGSIKIWEQYFIKGKIIGVESGVEAQVSEHSFGERVSIKNVDQTDPILAEEEYDIIIDDGGHTMKQQICSFEMLFPKVKKGGMYIIEDLETSYIERYNDYHTRTTEFLKSMVDNLNTKECDYNSISFYKYLCVIRK